MKIIECACCGSKELFEELGYVVCAYCQSRFTPLADDLPRKQTVIGMVSDVEMLLQKCRDDPANCSRYASLILDIDPTNHDAMQYLR